MQLIVYLVSVSLRLLELELCVSTTTKNIYFITLYLLFCEKYVQTYSILLNFPVECFQRFVPHRPHEYALDMRHLALSSQSIGTRLAIAILLKRYIKGSRNILSTMHNSWIYIL